MGCTSGKPNNIRSKRNNSGIVIEQKSKSVESPELAYQFIMMMKQQQDFEESNPKLMDAKRIYDQKQMNCPRLTMPGQSSIIRKRLSKLSKIQTQCTIQFQEQEKCVY